MPATKVLGQYCLISWSLKTLCGAQEEKCSEAGEVPTQIEEEGNDFIFRPNALCWEKVSLLETPWNVMCSDYSKKTKRRFRGETEGTGRLKTDSDHKGEGFLEGKWGDWELYQSRGYPEKLRGVTSQIWLKLERGIRGTSVKSGF